MNCPVCYDVRMREVEKNGVLIDICPDCKGVWLDRGELEKLMQDVREVREEFNEWYYGPPQQPYSQQQAYPPPQDYPDSYHSHKYDKDKYSRGYKKRKKRSVLDLFEDLFD